MRAIFQHFDTDVEFQASRSHRPRAITLVTVDAIHVGDAAPSVDFWICFAAIKEAYWDQGFIEITLYAARLSISVMRRHRRSVHESFITLGRRNGYKFTVALCRTCGSTRIVLFQLCRVTILCALHLRYHPYAHQSCWKRISVLSTLKYIIWYYTFLLTVW